MNETVILKKPDGMTSNRLFAIISSSSIIAEDAGVNIEPGDFILRTKPVKKIETYIVVNSSHKIPADGQTYYQIKVRKINSSTYVNLLDAERSNSVVQAHL